MGLFNWITTKRYMAEAKIDTIKAVGIKSYVDYHTPVGKAVDAVKEVGEDLGGIVKEIPNSIGIIAKDAVEIGKDKAEVLKDKGIDLSKKAGHVLAEEIKKMPDQIDKKVGEIEKEISKRAEEKEKSD